MNAKDFDLISEVHETRSLVQHKPCECKCRLIKVYVTQSKNGIMMKVAVSVNN